MVFFFFQAEDGIRYWSVTGVQTCALPICSAAHRAAAGRPDGPRRADVGGAVLARRPRPAAHHRRAARADLRLLPARSEERRVGKECRYRRAPYYYKNTNL